ncbi:MAG TPA: glycosyl transferase family 2, partial [Ktedonobacter sp.]|nr:glycosyl transferase family 2 [Ktedonobacter sp.]
EAVMMAAYFFPYQFILGAGAIRALFRYIQGTTNWEKTAHIGQHRNKVAV